jgi:hypothetical protein
MPRIEIERFEQAEDPADRSTEEFDRIAFAERAIALIRPAGMTVAICEGARRVTVEAGKQWGACPGSRWAVVSIPRDASRRAIARAVLSLYESNGMPPAWGGGGSPYRDGTGRPWVLDVLVGALGAT